MSELGRDSICSNDGIKFSHAVTTNVFHNRLGTKGRALKWMSQQFLVFFELDKNSNLPISPIYIFLSSNHTSDLQMLV